MNSLNDRHYFRALLILQLKILISRILTKRIEVNSIEFTNKKYDDLKTLKEDLESILGIKKPNEETGTKHKNFIENLFNKE